MKRETERESEREQRVYRHAKITAEIRNIRIQEKINKNITSIISSRMKDGRKLGGEG